MDLNATLSFICLHGRCNYTEELKSHLLGSSNMVGISEEVFSLCLSELHPCLPSACLSVSSEAPHMFDEEYIIFVLLMNA